MANTRRRSLAIGYVRSNPDEDADPLLSVEAQTRAIETYARFRGLTLDVVLVDEGVPGSIPIEARPGGEQLVSWLDRPEAKAVLVFHLERLFSSATECVEYVAAWDPRGIVLHILDLEGSSVDSVSPGGHLMMSVLRAARDMEAQQIKRGASPSLRSLHKRKRGAKLLLGEKVVRGYVVPDPVEAHAVKRIQALSQEGKSLRLIAEALDQEGIPTKRRRKAWSKEAIRLILLRIENGEIRDLRVDIDGLPET